ncbi:hypothetical protein ACFVP8_08415 [Viridibacillus arvi]|uniref:hypothetical protein n=1 Tax=Viridibacillus arvi TaxID=263475 RepID=UPI0036A58099
MLKIRNLITSLIVAITTNSIISIITGKFELRVLIAILIGLVAGHIISYYIYKNKQVDS